MIVPQERDAGRSIVSDSAATFLLKVLLFGLGSATSVLLSRGLGPEGRGVYYLPVIAAGTMVALCKLGLEQANVFLYGTRGLSIGRLSGQNGLVALGMGVLGAVGLLLAPSLLPSVFVSTPRTFIVLAGLAVPFSLHTILATGLLNLQGRVTWPYRAAVLGSAAQVVLLLALVQFRLLAVAPALAVYLVTILLTWILTASALEGARSWIRWDAGLLQDTLGHSLLLHLGMVFFFLHLRLDMFMVQGMVGTVALGLYSLSVGLAETVLLPTDSLAVAILPRQVGNTLEEAAATALRGARMNAILGGTLAAGWAALGLVVIKVFFGAAFVPAYTPLVGLLPGMVFLGMQRVCGAPVLRAGTPGRITAIYAVSLACNVVLNVWWIRLWGPLGAAFASSVSYGLGAVLFLGWTARLANAPLAAALVPQKSDWLMLWRTALQWASLSHHRPANRQVP